MSSVSENYFDSVRREIEPLLPQHAPRALEIGCAAGGTLAWLRGEGRCTWVAGVELNEAVAGRARPHCDLLLTGYVDSIELPIIAGMEVANGFSELNDPQLQADRFAAQAAARSAGDNETMLGDPAYIEALESGLPPTAGAGIGVDRLAMLFCDVPSIREVMLFPLLRPESGEPHDG